MQRLCLDCTATFEARKGQSRCPDCQAAKDRARDQRRGTSKQRGYDAVYHRNAAKVRAYAKAHNSPCELCWLPFEPGEAISVDHITPRSKRGTSDVTNLRPSHERCNSSRGNQSDEQYRRRINRDDIGPA